MKYMPILRLPTVYLLDSLAAMLWELSAACFSRAMQYLTS